MHYKQRHRWLSQQVYANTADYITLELYKQELHYIEVEYDYRPRYSNSDLKHTAKHKHTKHRPRCSDLAHTHVKHTR